MRPVQFGMLRGGVEQNGSEIVALGRYQGEVDAYRLTYQGEIRKGILHLDVFDSSKAQVAEAKIPLRHAKKWRCLLQGLFNTEKPRFKFLAPPAGAGSSVQENVPEIATDLNRLKKKCDDILRGQLAGRVAKKAEKQKHSASAPHDEAFEQSLRTSLQTSLVIMMTNGAFNS